MIDKNKLHVSKRYYLCTFTGRDAMWFDFR
nr:MAG TPA: hypothetical protein [Caudoviricetes sp.]